MTNIKTVESVADFIQLIKITDIVEAVAWVNKAAGHFPGAWQDFLKQTITEQRLQWLVNAFALEIISGMRHSQSAIQEIRRRGEAFLKEVLEKAADCGLNVSEISPMPIFGQR